MDGARNVKRQMTAGQARAKREQKVVSIRKRKRCEAIRKRRQQLGQDSATTEEIDAFERMDASEIENRGKEALSGLLQADRPSGETVARHVHMLRLVVCVAHAEQLDAMAENAQTLQRLVSCVRHGDSDTLRLDAAWTLSNLAAGPGLACSRVIEAEADLVALTTLQDDAGVSDALRRQLLWLLGNITGESVVARDTLQRHGLIDLLLREADKSLGVALHTDQTIVWVLMNMCRDARLSHEDIRRLVSAMRQRIVDGEDDPTKLDALWALAYVTFEEPVSCNLIAADATFMRTLSAALQIRHDMLRFAVLRIFGNMASNPEDTLTAAVIAAEGALTAIASLSQAADAQMRQEATWLLSNMAAGTESQIDALFEKNVHRTALYLGTLSECALSREAAWTLRNLATNGRTRHRDALNDADAMYVLASMLDRGDLSIILVVMETLALLLDAGFQRETLRPEDAPDERERFERAGGYDKLDLLAAHQNEHLSDCAQRILRRHPRPTEHDIVMTD